jgi:Spy/CpxP family protein refolding chaperone
MQKFKSLFTLLCIDLLTLSFSVSATPLTYDALSATDSITIQQTSNVSPQAKWDPYRFAEGKAQFPGLTMSEDQQKQLFALIKNQAGDRRQVEQAARQALIKLQQLAIADNYDHAEAKRLADSYGSALAELTLLNIQLASQVRDLLTAVQLQALQNTMDKVQQGD